MVAIEYIYSCFVANEKISIHKEIMLNYLILFITLGINLVYKLSKFSQVNLDSFKIGHKFL